MRLGIFAKTFAGSDPVKVLTAVAAAGFTTTQYNMACSGLAPMPDQIPAHALEGITAAVLASGVEIVALSGTYNMVHPDVAVRKLGHRRLDLLASIARQLPAKLVTLCTGTRDAFDMWRAHPENSQPGAYADLLAALETAIHIAERHDVDLGIEPEHANVVCSAAVARRVIDDLGSQRLKIVLDPANLVEQQLVSEQRLIVSEAIDLLADRIAMVHAKDRNAAGVVVAAGKGVIDFAHFFRALARAGFNGPAVAHGLAATEAADVAQFLKQTLDQTGITVSPGATVSR